MAPQSKFSDFKDEVGEIMVETGNVVKKQLTQKPVDNQTRSLDQARDDKKVDPTTGKPVPSKKMLGNLSQQVAQLSQMRLKNVREELEKQRLKIEEKKAETGQGPEIKHEEKKPQDDAVAKTLAASKSTGEIKGTIGG